MGTTPVPPKASTDFNADGSSWDADRIVICANEVDYFIHANWGNGAAAQWPFNRTLYLPLRMAVGDGGQVFARQHGSRLVQGLPQAKKKEAKFI